MFQAPTALPSHTEISEISEVTPVFEEPAEVTVVSSRPEGRRKRKRSIEQPYQSTSVSDLLPLQREVLLKQMEVFSAQLQLIEEQREYYPVFSLSLLGGGAAPPYYDYAPPIVPK